jgi:antitoxin (DNA-binding transcriptional repressor) of toxin-antitoxin stability system
MLDMKRATIREVQHNLAGVLRWVEEGEEVQVLRRGRIVARLVPPTPEMAAPKWPDFAARAKAVWRRPVQGKPVARIISEDREDRL